MISNNISATTLWVIGGFLLLTLILGLYAGKGIKDIKEYALGKNRFSTSTLVLTFLATKIGGSSIFGEVSSIYTNGIIVLIAQLGTILRNILLTYLIAPKIAYFKNCLTIGDMMYQLYGKFAKILTGVLTFSLCICVVGIQLIVFGDLAESFLGMDKNYVILITGIILGIYSALGGIRAVTFTDVLQFLVLIISIPLIATYVLKKAGGYKEIFLNLPSEKLNILNHPKKYYYLAYFFIWSFFPMLLTDPGMMQRTLMSSNKDQIRNKFKVITVFDYVFRLIVLMIGLSAIILYPNIKPSEILPTIVNSLFPGEILKGIVISGLFAVVMSTADSYLHAAGLVFSHDIIKTITDSKKIKFNELKFAKIFTITVAFFNVLIAIKSFDITYLNFFCIKLVGPILLFPLLIGILRVKTDNISLILGSIAGISTFLFASKFLPKNLDLLSIPISIIANGITYMIHHIIKNKGLAWIERTKEEKEQEKLWILNPQKILNKLVNIIPTPRKIYNYSKYQVMKNGSQNILFGIYACINFTLPYFLWDHQDLEKYNLMITLRLLGGVMAGLLIVKDQWKEFLKPYYSLYWHITLTYCLPFITTVMFLLTGGSTSWLLNVGTSIFFLIMLVTGEVFLILAPLGVIFALIFYKFYIGPINLSSLGFDINYYLIYQVVFSTIIGLLFAYRKRIFNIIQGDIGLNLGSALCHELRNTLYSLTCNQYNRIRMERIEQEEPKVIEGEESYIISKQLFDSFLDQTNQAINFDEDTLKVIKTFEKIFKEYKKSITNPEICSMKSVIEYTLRELHFLPGQKEKVKLNLTDDFYVKLPKSAFAFVISNIIRNAFKHGRATEVEIKLENHQLKIKDNGVGIPPSKLEKIFKMHYTTGQEDSSGIGLGFAKLIVESIYGEIWCESEQGENSYSEFIIRFPEVPSSEISTEVLNGVNQDGFIKGERQSKEKIVIKMLKEGESIKKIAEYTELKKSEIEEIKNSLNL